MSGRPGDIYMTSDKARVNITPCAPHVFQHAKVLFSAGDNTIRQRALDELKRLVDDTDSNGAAAVLEQFVAWKEGKAS
jgi:hypothetical protein